MDEIRPWLFIGKFRDTLDKDYLEFKSIKAMLQLAEKVEQPDIETLFLPVEDLAPIAFNLISKGIEFIKEQRSQKHRILVACGAGINRSTAFCVIALKELEGLNLLDAYKEVKKYHPEAFPNEPIWDSLCEFHNEQTPFLEVMRLAAK